MTQSHKSKQVGKDLNGTEGDEANQEPSQEVNHVQDRVKLPALHERDHSTSTMTTASTSKPDSHYSSSFSKQQRRRYSSPGEQRPINHHGELPSYIPRPRRASSMSATLQSEDGIPKEVNLTLNDAIPLEIQLLLDNETSKKDECDLNNGNDTEQTYSSSGNNSNSSDTIHVNELELEDSMGDEGIFTGKILRDSHYPHGKGNMRYDKYRSYNGEWSNGDWHGRGEMVNERSYSYKGNFRHNEKHGHGVLSYKDGRRYIGNFENDERHGEGYLVFPDGSYYRGSFKHDKFHGKGVSKFAQGGHYNGNWRRGKYDGYGICVWSDGRVYRGEWKKNGMTVKEVRIFCLAWIVVVAQESTPLTQLRFTPIVEYRADGSLRHEGEFQNDRPVRESTS